MPYSRLQTRYSAVVAARTLTVAFGLLAWSSWACCQGLGQPVEVEDEEEFQTHTITRSDSAPSRSGNTASGTPRYERPAARNSILPKFEMPIWEYVYRKVRDPSADIRMIAPATAGKGRRSNDSLWTRMGRTLGLSSPEPDNDALAGGGDGILRAIPADRRSDRYTNKEFLEAEEYFRKEEYAQARRAFKKLAKKYKDKPLEEDILFMKAECEFKLDWLPAAQDSYAALLTKYPTSRYMPQAVQRTYDIAYYWLEDSRLIAEGQSPKHSFSRYVNLFDRTRPWLDTNGRAIEAIETIQQYDPFGPLTDDAVMMAGAESFVSNRYVQAAGYYEQLVTDQPQSEHSNKALFLSGQAYLRSYRGPEYDASDLNGAYRMTKTALARGEAYSPEELRRLEADLRAIHVERAKRDFEVGENFRRRLRYTSAKFYYHQVIKDFPDTDWARRAEDRLRELGDKETYHLDLAKMMKSPFEGFLGRARPEQDPFAAQAGTSAATGKASPKRSARPNAPEDAPPDEEDAEADKDGEGKSFFNLKNWLEKF